MAIDSGIPCTRKDLASTRETVGSPKQPEGYRSATSIANISNRDEPGNPPEHGLHDVVRRTWQFLSSGRYNHHLPRISLTERRRTQTRHEIAKVALELFGQAGYERVTAEMIAEESGVSLRTFYRYFSGKDEVLSPIVTQGTEQFAEMIADRPADEDLSTAVQRAYEQQSSRVGTAEVRELISVLTDVPTLRARWMSDLRTIEDALKPVIRQRTSRRLSDAQVSLTAAAIVTALRVTLEQSARPGSEEPRADRLGHALRYVRDGANL